MNGRKTLPFTETGIVTVTVLRLIKRLSVRKPASLSVVRQTWPDENDNIFVECAFASNSDFLVTSNIKDFKRSELKGFMFEVITPREFYKKIEEKNE